jgi:hypothetical protein
MQVVQGDSNKMSLYGGWGPGSKEEIALVNMDPRSFRGVFETPCICKEQNMA